ncbi:MAG: hypothetical protein ABSG36_16500 [Acidimicrobiales bacterium]|jgi:hypothetical protein
MTAGPDEAPTVIEGHGSRTASAVLLLLFLQRLCPPVSFKFEQIG